MSEESEKAIREAVADAAEVKPAPIAMEARDSEQGDSGRRGQAQIDVLIKLASEAAPFRTPDGIGYVDVKIDNHRETWPIKSVTCSQWLSQRYFEGTRRPPNSEPLKAAIAWLDAQAKFAGPERRVHVRVAREDGRIYLDLGDEHWRAIEITVEGWSILADPPIRFRRPPGMKPLPVPSERGSIVPLKQFLNVSDSDFVLVVSWMLAAMRGQGPYLLLAISGEQGSAKSTFSKLIRAIVDPHDAPLRTLPHTDRDLYIAATSGHVLAFDNVSHIKPSVSDALCRLSTGGSFSSRRLYTDQEEVIISASCPVSINGIEEVVVGQDLVDRTLQIILHSISEDRRLPDDELRERFDEELPGILGALLDALVCGLKNYPNIAARRLPRMAAPYKFVLACEPALWPAGTFERAFWRNRDEAVQVGIEADPVACAIVGLVTQTLRTLQTRESRYLPERVRVFEGTATDLLRELINHTDNLVLKSPHWPRVAHALSGKLKRSAPPLRALGITFENALVGRQRTRTIYIDVQTAKFLNQSSPSSDLEVSEECEFEIDPDDLEATSVPVSKTVSAPSAPSVETMKAPTPPEQPKRQGIVVVRKPANQITTAAAPPPAAAPEVPTAAAAKPAVKGRSVPKPRPLVPT